MSYLLKIKTADEAEWLNLQSTYLAEMSGVQTVVFGTVRHTTGETEVVDGFTVPVTVPVPGYLVDLIAPSVPVELYPYLVNPVQPRHVWYGNHVLAMPEVLEEDGDTLMFTRGIGDEASDQQKDSVEVEYVRQKLSVEERAERKAIHAAVLAVIEKRAERNRLAVERARLTAEVAAKTAERDAAVLKRAEELSKRDAAVASLVGKVGAARTPLIAARDAATAALVKVAPIITEATEQLRQLVEQRAIIVNDTVAANTELLRLRNITIYLRNV